MAYFLECKQCGGQVAFEEGELVSLCPYCGSQNTTGKSAGDQSGLVNRANYLRRNNEFDKAAAVYEELLRADNTDYEAHWGLVLCKYGIEYVEDPASGERKPTCHRTFEDSVFTDIGYRSALEFAPLAVREVYEKEAAEIDAIQKSILSLSRREEKYDVFLCYKENDEAGNRTEDSVIAQELEFELSRRGYRVFFARKTLEHVLGSAYEPVIYAALQSARAMVVLGTKPEHFSAVWVRNEWSRYRALIKQGAEKILIPAYRGMSPYDLPLELSNLQALDMGKLGFVQDLCDGIDRFSRSAKRVQEPASSAAPAVSGAPGTDALLKRAFLFIEEGSNQKADEYLERVLDQNPEEPRAYLAKLLIELGLKTEGELKNRTMPLDGYANYQKALRFASGDLKARYAGYQQAILDRIAEEDRLKAEREEQRRAAEAAAAEQRRAQEAALIAKRQAEQAAEQEQRRIKREKAKRFHRVFWPVVIVVAIALVFGVPAIEKSAKYRQAAEQFDQGEYRQAQTLYEQLGDYKDAQAKADTALAKANEADYSRAAELMENGDYDAAAEAFLQLGTYRDASAQYKKANYKSAIAAFDRADYLEAAHRLSGNGHYLETDEYLYTCAYQLLEAEQYGASARAWQAGGKRVADAEQDADMIKVVDWLEHSLAANRHLIAVKLDGSCLSAGPNDSGQCDISGWGGLVEVAAASSVTIGRSYDGETGAVGDNTFGQCDVSGWKDIAHIAAGEFHTVGLKTNGRVVATGNNDAGQCDVSEWRDIVDIAAAWSNTVGLKADGTVVVIGFNGSGQCDVSGWTDIVSIASGGSFTVGLKRDGTVVVEGIFAYNEQDSWTDIVSICASASGILGLKSDGTVVFAGNPFFGQDQVGDWKNIIAIAAGDGFTAGLDEDGVVHVAGDNSNGVCDVGWDIW